MIADYVRREVDFRRVVRQLAMVAYGQPEYRWQDEAGRTHVEYDPPPDHTRLQVTVTVPERRDRERAARRLHEMGTGGKVLRHKIESGVPQRTAIDQWLDSLTPAQVQLMLGTRTEPAYVEVERVEDTVPVEDD